MNRFLLIPFMLLILSSILSGCASPPKMIMPEPIKLETFKDTSLEPYEREYILKRSFDTTEIYHRKKHLKVISEKLMFIRTTRAAKVGHSFYLDTNQDIQRKDTIVRNDEFIAYSNELSDLHLQYVINFQNKLVDLYNERLNAYVEYKRLHPILSAEFDNIYDEAKISIEDQSGILSAFILEEILSTSTKHKFKKDFNIESSFGRYGLNKDVHDEFKITFDLPETIGRYKFSFKNNQAWQTKDFKAYVTSIKYNFVPKSFTLSDDTLEITASNDTLTFTNKTNNYINIESISSYYNQSVETLDNTNLKLAPKSKKDYSISNFKYFGDEYIYVEAKDQLVNFGFAISYYNKDIDKRTTLFDTKNYSIFSFD